MSEGAAVGEQRAMVSGAPASGRARPVVLDVHGLALSYGDLAVLRDFNLEVEDGDFVCLLGPSGCGKTTVLKLVAGLVEPQRGEIRVDGHPISGPGTDRSMVFQNYGLLPWRTVLGNVEFGLEIRGVPREARRQAAREQITRLGLAGFERHYPSQLSGGMQQRVALARAFTKNPRLLLMDEPFAAVDLQMREYLQEELLRVWEQIRTTVIFVTHSIDEALYLGDRVVVMSARGGDVRADLRVDLSRPRYETDVKASPRFGELRHLIRETLRGPGGAGTAEGGSAQ
jgi:NitT/TauT family transport system ATP-binding protein